MPKLYAGLDVSDAETSICVVDDSGASVFAAATPTSATAIAKALKPFRRNVRNVGLESGTHASRLYKDLERAGFPIVCLDARHANAALRTRLNKTDVNDAEGLARLLARGIYTLSHIKSDEAIRIKMLLVMRRSMINKARDLRICRDMNFKQINPGERVKRRSAMSDVDIALQDAAEGLQRTLDQMHVEIAQMQKTVESLAKHDAVCRRLMTVPGVGPVSAITYRAAIDDPTRFTSSRTVAAFFGLTPKVRQSGQMSHTGHISRAGDRSVRATMYSSAHALLSTSRSECALRKWGLRLAKQKGRKVAYIACARKLAVLLHHLWVTGQDFDPLR